jgi:cellulose synthase/poly-beta-1,6-N-acetylglucosamine synthase-like glycosyltransferase
MNSDFTIIINIIQIGLLVYLGFATLYIFVYAAAGLFYTQPEYSESAPKQKIAVMIPGYKEDEVIVEVAKDALLQDYPQELFDVIVIADSFEPETISKLKGLKIKLIEVSFEKSTKSKALNKAMEQLPDDYGIAVILDADNIMARDFLTKINATIDSGFYIVQGHRTAKNINTSMAVLDAVSEEINNHIFRKGHRALGLSSAIIGSGMAFRYGFFKELMSKVKAIGGFDKEIELKVMKDGYKIAYLNDALVYDEKVQNAEVFHNQRRRWLSAQIKYSGEGLFSSIKELLMKGNIDFFDKTLQTLQPPRILLLGAVIILTAVFVTLNIVLQTNILFIYFWLVLFLMCILVFIFSIPGSFYNARTMKALASLPGGMFLMFRSLVTTRGANKQFIHTKHTSSISNTHK